MDIPTLLEHKTLLDRSMKAPKPDDTKQNKNTLLNFHFALQNLKYNVIDNISNDTYNRLQGAQLICTFIFFLS